MWQSFCIQARTWRPQSQRTSFSFRRISVAYQYVLGTQCFVPSNILCIAMHSDNIFEYVGIRCLTQLTAGNILPTGFFGERIPAKSGRRRALLRRAAGPKPFWATLHMIQHAFLSFCTPDGFFQLWTGC